MSVARWPGTTYGPVVQIGYETELGCEFEWDCAVWGGELPEPPAADLVEPFDNYTDNGWDLMSSGATIAAGRTGTAAESTFGTHSGPTYNVPVPDQSDTLTVGFAWRWTDATVNLRTVAQFRGPSGTHFHTRLRAFPADGSLAVENPGWGLNWTSATGLVARNVWAYIEVQTKMSDTAGTVTVRVNGTPVITATGVNTYAGVGPLLYGQLRLAQETSFCTGQWDDLYLTSGPDGVFLGDITVTRAGPRAVVEDPGRWGPWWEWRNFECDVRAGSSIVRGTASPSQRPSSSTASLSLTPADETMAPWYVDGSGEHPNRGNLPMRVGVTNLVTEEEWWLFTGWIDYLTEVDSPDELSLTLVSSDGFKHLALLNQGEQAAQGAGEAAGSRINRILNRSEWRSTRELAPGTFALQATTLAAPALEEIFLVADTEGGVVWVDTSGAFRFGDRDWLREKAETTRWRVGDHEVDPEAICVASIVSTADDMDVQNVIGISRVGGTAAWLEDADSIAKYGRHSWSRFDLPYADDADTDTILQFQLSDRAARDYHVQAVVFSPLVEPDAWELCTQVELFDTVYVTRRRGDAVLAETASVIGIDHSFGPGEFVTVLSLGPRIRQSLARWDFDLWDTARWSAT